MNCPVCDTELKSAERQGIDIDFCARCRGVWLDRGELEKIIERSARQQRYDDDERRYDGQRPQEPPGQYPPGGRRREGFFSRLFDFD